MKRRSVLTVLALAAGLIGAAVGPASPASAAPQVSVTVADRPELSGVADSTYLTEVTVRGTGFQSIQNGFGGIYVLFGWADQSSWRPSAGGLTGTNYRYVYDDETNPVGYQLFVTFPGSSTAYAANGGTLAADGSWSATMRIPGSSFQAYDRSGNVSTVDCTQVQCGIMTIGAHGVVNASNESFTPIAFQDIYTAEENRQVVTSTGTPTGSTGEGSSTLVAPETIGGRPATIPAIVDADALGDEQAGGVTAAAGEQRLTLTVPGSDPEGWIGVTFYPEELFAGWFQPSSTGAVDIDFPENLPAGEHRAVVSSVEDEVVGWADFELAAAEAESEPTSDASEQPAEAVAEGSDLQGLWIAVIAVGVLALAAVAFLVITLLRGRRRAATAGEPADAADSERQP